MEGKTIVYIVTGIQRQSIEEQRSEISDYCQKNGIMFNDKNMYVNKTSARDSEKDSYALIKQSIKKGDILIIKDLDCLGKDIQMIKEEWQYLLRMGADIIVTDTPMLNTTDKTELEKKLITNIVFEMLEYIMKKERIKNKQRHA